MTKIDKAISTIISNNGGKKIPADKHQLRKVIYGTLIGKGYTVDETNQIVNSVFESEVDSLIAGL